MKFVLSIAVALTACGSNGGAGGAGGADGGSHTGAGGSDASGTGGDQSPECGTLRGVIRDFKIAHPDFEVVPANDVVIKGLVNPTITPGGRPTLSANAPSAGLITSAATFDQWYTNVDGINLPFVHDFVLAETPVGSGQYVYDDHAYFPIDNQGFGDEGNPHNYHFTTEIHATFSYAGGERFTFTGDDDVWVFVNGKLAIDIGGVHSASESTIDFDARAAELGITPGHDYAIDFFQAERHVTESNFRIQTSIACFVILF